MSTPLFIDNITFAKNNTLISGNLSLSDCPRLFTLVEEAFKSASIDMSETQLINFNLQGSTDVANQHFLHLEIIADLHTICQRCFGVMPLNLTSNFNYLISNVQDLQIGAGEIDGDDDIDLQQASSSMDIITLIEDELLMAMPIATLHREYCGKIISQSGEKANPFAVLKRLKKTQ